MQQEPTEQPRGRSDAAKSQRSGQGGLCAHGPSHPYAVSISSAAQIARSAAVSGSAPAACLVHNKGAPLGLFAAAAGDSNAMDEGVTPPELLHRSPAQCGGMRKGPMRKGPMPLKSYSTWARGGATECMDTKGGAGTAPRSRPARSAPGHPPAPPCVTFCRTHSPTYALQLQ